VSINELVIQGRGPQGSGFRAWHNLFRENRAYITQPGGSHRECGMSRSVTGINPNSLFGIFDSLPVNICPTSAIVQKISRLPVGQLCVGVYRMGAFQAALLLRCQFSRNFRGNRARDLVLQDERVAKVALVGPSPEVFLGRYLDEVRGYPKTIARPRDRSFDDGVYVKLPRDLSDGLLCLLILITEVRAITRSGLA